MNGRNLAIALVIGLFIGAGATYALAGARLGRTTTITSVTTKTEILPPVTSTITINFTQEVASAYLAHIKNIESENGSAIIGGYENNATLSLAGDAAGLAGTYATVFDISILYASLLSPRFFSTVNIDNMSYAVSSLGSGDYILNSTFTMYGNSTNFIAPEGSSVIGTYVANIASNVSYVRVDNAWVISNESWNFTSLDWTV